MNMESMSLLHGMVILNKYRKYYRHHRRYLLIDRMVNIVIIRTRAELGISNNPRIDAVKIRPINL